MSFNLRDIRSTLSSRQLINSSWRVFCNGTEVNNEDGSTPFILSLTPTQSALLGIDIEAISEIYRVTLVNNPLNNAYNQSWAISLDAGVNKTPVKVLKVEPRSQGSYSIIYLSKQ